MTNALLYVRVSHDDQVKFGMSLEAQEESLKEYCKVNDLQIKGIYRDEGISGGSIEKREAFKSMISEATAGDVILFTKLDRFSRNLLDANVVIQGLDKKNVSIKAINEDDIDTTTADGKFIFNLKLSLAEREREKTSERIRDVFKYKRQNKEVLNGSTPLGYKIKNKRLVIDQENTERVKYIFNEYDRTSSFRMTTRAYNSKYDCNVKVEWIRTTLKNRIYIGERAGIENYCEPIIDRALFDRVAERIGTNYREAKRTFTYLFNGLIVCPECGCHLNGMTANRRNESVNYYYRCRHHYTEISCPYNKVISEMKIEKQLLDEIAIFARQEKYEIEKTQKADYSKEILAITNKLERLKELYIEGDITKSNYDSRKSSLLNEKNKYEELQGKVKKSCSEEILKLNVKEIYERLNRENKSMFWHRFIKGIIIDQEGKIVKIEFTQE